MLSCHRYLWLINATSACSPSTWTYNKSLGSGRNAPLYPEPSVPTLQILWVLTIDRIGVSGPLDVKQALGKSGAGFRHWRRNRKHGPRSVPRAEESKVEHEAIFLIIQNL